MPTRLNYATKIIGGLLLFVLGALLWYWMETDAITGYVFLCSFCLSTGIILLCESFIGLPGILDEVDKIEKKTNKKINSSGFDTVFAIPYVIAGVFIILTLILMIIGTFGSMKAELWLAFLLNLTAIMLLYSNSLMRAVYKMYEDSSENQTESSSEAENTENNGDFIEINE